MFIFQKNILEGACSALNTDCGHLARLEKAEMMSLLKPPVKHQKKQTFQSSRRHLKTVSIWNQALKR